MKALVKSQVNYLCILLKSESWKDSRKVSSALKTILKTDFANLLFLELWERRRMSINLICLHWRKPTRSTCDATADWGVVFLSHPSCMDYGIAEFMIKIAQTRQNSWKWGLLTWRNGKLRRLSGRFHSLIWRPGDTVQNLESSGLYGRVDSTG